MIDTSTLTTASAAGIRLTTALPFNGSNNATFMLLTRLKSGGDDRDALPVGRRQKILQIGNDTVGQGTIVHADLVNYGSGVKLRTYLFYTAGVGIELDPSDIGLADWTSLEDKWLVIALQYRGGGTPHKQFVGYHTGSAWNTYEFTASGNTNTLSRDVPNHYAFGWTSGQNSNERTPYTDFNLYYQFHDESWTKATFDAVCDSLIDDDGTMKSLAGPINLVAGSRAGPSNVAFVGPVKRPESASFTQTYYGDDIDDGVPVGGILKTTGYIESTAVKQGTGADSVLVDPDDFGWAEDPEAVTPDVRATGQRGPKLAQALGTPTEQIVVSAISNSRSGQHQGMFFNDGTGIPVKLDTGQSLSSSQYPNGHKAVGTGYASGLGAHLIDKVVGEISCMPQGLAAYTANSTPRWAETLSDVAATSGSYSTGSVLGGWSASNTVDKNFQRFGLWSNANPGLYTGQCGMMVTRLAPGQKARWWFLRAGAMTQDGSVALSAYVLGLPTTPGADPEVVLRAMSHGASTTPTSHPSGSGSPDFIASGTSYPIGVTARGTNDNPTYDLTTSDVTLPPGDTTGDQPEVGDVILITGDNLSGRMVPNVVDSEPNGSGACTVEHVWDANNNGSTAITNPVMTWGALEVKKLETAIQEGEPNGHGPFIGIEVENPSGSGQDVIVLGVGVRDYFTPGVIPLALGQGGAGYEPQYDNSFTTADASGKDPIAKAYEAMGIGVALVYPGYQSSDADDAQDIVSRFELVPDCEVVGAQGIRWPETAFSTPGTADGFANWLYENVSPAADVSGTASNNHAWIWGWNRDTQHYSAEGARRSAEAITEALSGLELQPTTTGNAALVAWQWRRRRRRRITEDERG